MQRVKPRQLLAYYGWKVSRSVKRRRNGIVGRLERSRAMESYLINAKETMQLLGVSEGMAYKIIAQCNQELAKKGFITIRGKAPRVYLMERVGIKEVNA